MAKRGRGGRKSWQALSRDVDKAKRLGIKPAAKAHASARPRKGKEKAAPPADPMDREVPVKLGKEAIRVRENELAEKILLRRRLTDELRETVKARRAAIETLNEEITKLAQTCVDGVDSVRQGDLRFEDQRAKEELGKVAKGIKEHAAEGTAAEAVAMAWLPSEPHPFVKTSEGPDCKLCGSTSEDPIHAGMANEFVESLQRVNDGEPVGDVVDDIKARRSERAAASEAGA